MTAKKDIPELRLDKTKIRVMTFAEKEAEEIEYWKNTSLKERLQHIERLRRLNYGVRATGHIQRVIRVVK
jgi:hypothetical protein